MGTIKREIRQQDPEGGAESALGELVGGPTGVVTREQKFHGPENGGGWAPVSPRLPIRIYYFDLTRVPRLAGS